MNQGAGGFGSQLTPLHTSWLLPAGLLPFLRLARVSTAIGTW
jgi:hypothetical protein